jgi:hypothetical protein
MNSFGFATPMATPPRGDPRQRSAPPAKAIPFDYVFQFALQGVRGNKVQDVVEISTEGVFVALSVGYSLMLDEKSTARTFQPLVDPRITLEDPTFVPFFIPPADIDPVSFRFAGLLLTGVPRTEMDILDLNTTPLITPPTHRIGPDGTVPVPLNTLGTVSILRIWDKTHNRLSELYEVNSNVANDIPVITTPVIGPHPINKRVPTAGDTIVHVYGSPTTTVEVFLLESKTGTVLQVIKPDNSGSFTLDDMPTFGQRTGRAEVPLRVSNQAGEPIKSLSVGDMLLVRRVGTATALTGIPLSMFVVARPRAVSDLTLAELEAGLEEEKIGADLTRGFRLNPNAANLVAADLPLDRLSDGTLGRIFETGSVAAEEVSFLYSLDVGDTGREHQNRPIHNIAGLGIANGDRPSRPFAKPMVFEPRSFIRLQIEEISGPPGTLFIVLQGYKILGAGRIPG